jgi:hypothetical protein
MFSRSLDFFLKPKKQDSVVNMALICELIYLSITRKREKYSSLFAACARDVSSSDMRSLKLY